ncbi:MAG: hypothetical protein R3A45_01545 [Bdellovibrionota bacterium]
MSIIKIQVLSDQAGVVPASYDYNGTLTESSDDNMVQFSQSEHTYRLFLL